jgi:hypothetical protein
VREANIVVRDADHAADVHKEFPLVSAWLLLEHHIA